MAKRATGICIYHGKTLYMFAVITHDIDNIVLYKNSDGREFETFQDMYHCLLKLLKNNNFYAKSYSNIGLPFYDIHFIDRLCPTSIDLFGYMK